MKSSLRSAIALVLLIAVLSSCKNNTPKQAKYIPKTASVVLVLDAQSMQDKLQKGGINTDTLLNRFFKQSTPDSADKERLNELRTNAGIDWNKQLYFFMAQKNDGAGSEMVNIFNVMGSLSNATQFEAFLKKQKELKDKEIKKEAGYSYIMPENGTMVSWNDQQVITTIYNRTAKPVYDTVTMSFKQPAPVNTDEALKKEVTAYFTQKEEESLAGVDVFVNMFKEKADGYAFTSSNSSLSALSMMPLQIPKLEELLKDNYSTSVLYFEDGKIAVRSTSYPNKLVSAVLKEYPSPAVDLSMIEHYPSTRINGIMQVAFNPEIIGGLLKQLEVEGLANGFLDKAGLTTQDIYKSFKGNIAFVLSDVGMAQPEPQMRKDESSMVHKRPVYKMILNAAVGNKDSFFKLMNKAVEQGLLVKQGTTYKGGGLLSMLGMYLVADDKNLVLASDSLTYTQYMANTGKASINKEAMDRFKDKTGVFYFDIANTLNSFATDTDATGGYHHSIHTAKKTFKDIIVTADQFNGSTIKAVGEIRMQDQKQNSLVTLTSFLTDVAVDMHEKARKEKEMDDKIFSGGLPAIIRTN